MKGYRAVWVADKKYVGHGPEISDAIVALGTKMPRDVGNDDFPSYVNDSVFEFQVDE
jgi:hypothetical protein